MKLSIIIPVFNKFNFSKACINDLLHLPSDHEIIIVDNGSTDETKEYFKDNKEIKYLRNEENEGFAKACNRGYKESLSENVLFLNNDIRVRDNKNGWTEEIIKKCEIGLVGPTMGQLDDKLNFVQEANKELNGKSYLSGWCLGGGKKIFDKLDLGGGEIFSQEFGLAYFEDTDLSFRAKEIGILLQLVNIPVVHFGKVSSQQLNTKELYVHARKIFVKKWNQLSKK